MKKLVPTLAVIALTALTTYGQGRVSFDNTFSGNLISIDLIRGRMFEGAPGAHLGSNYSIQLLWAAGTFANQAAFDAANPQSSASVAFFGTTGNDGSGAGFFDGGTVAMNGPAGTYTMQARAWFNNGLYATYDIAVAGSHNRGLSALITVSVTAPQIDAIHTVFPSFVVESIPEPSTLALAVLTCLSFLLFRYRK